MSTKKSKRKRRKKGKNRRRRRNKTKNKKMRKIGNNQVKKLYGKIVGKTKMMQRAKIRKYKLFITFWWVFPTAIVITGSYILGFIYTAIGFTTHPLIYIASIYLVPAMIASFHTGSSRPDRSKTWGRLFQYVLIAVLVIMTVYIIFLVINIINGSIGGVENAIMLGIVIFGLTYVWVMGIVTIFWTNTVIREYNKIISEMILGKQSKTKECFTVRGFFDIMGDYSTIIKMMYIFVLILLAGFAMTTWFGYQHSVSSVPTHWVIHITTFFTFWAVLIISFFIETIEREVAYGAIAVVAALALGACVFGVLVIAIYYTVMLIVFSGVVCCSTVALEWTLIAILIFNIVQALVYVVIGAFSVYFMVKYDLFTKPREAYEDRFELFTSKINGK